MTALSSATTGLLDASVTYQLDKFLHKRKLSAIATAERDKSHESLAKTVA